jgi:phosphatidylethanolamine-binding protein (PEBP) family uncharacterized protein
MGLNSAKGTAKSQFNSSAQKTAQSSKKTSNNHAPKSSLAGGPKPPGWVQKKVQSKVHAQNMKKLSQKAKLKNDFTKSAAKKSNSKQTGMTRNFNQRARQK